MQTNKQEQIYSNQVNLPENDTSQNDTENIIYVPPYVPDYANKARISKKCGLVSLILLCIPLLSIPVHYFNYGIGKILASGTTLFGLISIVLSVAAIVLSKSSLPGNFPKGSKANRDRIVGKITGMISFILSALEFIFIIMGMILFIAFFSMSS